MSSPSAGKRRMDSDLMRLIQSNHEVHLTGKVNEFTVKFHGPKDTPYEGGVWKVRVDLPEKYPFKSPSIGFMNRIFHPNIDEASGTVCLDVINQAWSSLYDLTNIFESFLPQLLAYPNPSDPLNGDAASLFLNKPEEFKQKCVSYVKRYATEDAIAKISDDHEIATPRNRIRPPPTPVMRATNIPLHRTNGPSVKKEKLDKPPVENKKEKPGEKNGNGDESESSLSGCSDSEDADMEI
uniref:Ubiquitin-conjugating enzyme E2 H n=1 Tax=Parastrongyloides trichosuri TaxID=131310 RepID=A0A0N5A3J7_PARTI